MSMPDAPLGFRRRVVLAHRRLQDRRHYQELFRSLKGRGLKDVELVVSDELHEGLKAAIARHFQGASY